MKINVKLISVLILFSVLNVQGSEFRAMVLQPLINPFNKYLGIYFLFFAFVLESFLLWKYKFSKLLNAIIVSFSSTLLLVLVVLLMPDSLFNYLMINNLRDLSNPIRFIFINLAIFIFIIVIKYGIYYLSAKKILRSIKYLVFTNILIYGLALILLSIFYPIYYFEPGSFSETTCKENMSHIAKILKMYSVEHNGELPSADSIEEMKLKLEPYRTKADYINTIGQNIVFDTLFECPMERLARTNKKTYIYSIKKEMKDKSYNYFCKYSEVEIMYCDSSFHGKFKPLKPRITGLDFIDLKPREQKMR
ncbi:MAG: hypothetical protein ABH873_08795 [Candidatus Firestonebacteria bacterium]